MCSKQQLYDSARRHCNPVRCLYSSGLLQAEGIIRLFFSARSGRAWESSVVSLPKQFNQYSRRTQKIIFFLITNSLEAANWQGKDIFSYFVIFWDYLPNVGGGILNNFWSVGFFPHGFQNEYTMSKLLTYLSKTMMVNICVLRDSKRDFGDKWVVGFGCEATFSQLFCTAGLKCTGNPLHIVGIFGNEPVFWNTN